MYNFFQEHNNENRTLHQSGFWGFFLAATVCSKQIVYSSLFDMTLTLLSEFFHKIRALSIIHLHIYLLCTQVNVQSKQINEMMMYI